jgi:transcriptional regulator with XRE-family HTH domain
MQGSLPTKLRVLRAERGLTLREAAELVKVRPATLSDIEQGRSRPHDTTLAKIASAYNVPLTELLEEPVPLGEAPATGPTEALSEDIASFPDVLEMDNVELEDLRVQAREDAAVHEALKHAQKASLNNRLAAERMDPPPEDLAEIKQRDRRLFKLWTVAWYERNREAINDDPMRSTETPFYPDLTDLSLDDAFAEVYLRRVSSGAGV